MQQLTGVNAIVTQIGSIVSQHNAEFGYYTPLIVNFVQWAATFGSIWTLGQFGRKTVLVAGNAALGIFDIVIGVLFIFIDRSSAIFWLVFAILLLYMISFSTTIGPATWLYVPEIVPAKIVPFATVFNWLGCFFAIIILPIINASLGDYAVFFLFGILTIITAIINIFGLVEIKGLNVK
jgi:hypothetical protein